MLENAMIEFAYEIEAGGEPFLIAKPFDTRHQTFLGVEIAGGRVLAEIGNQFGGQEALHVRPEGAGPVRLAYRFSEVPGTPPAWLAAPMPTAWLAPSEALAAEIRAIVTATTPEGILRQVIDHTATHFEYGHPDAYLGTGAGAMPALACDLAMGSCVDIHSYAIAALAVFGIPATYLSGAYCEGEAPGVSEPCIPGHCWMESHAGATEDWDIAHVLKFGLPLPVSAMLNPKPGRRIALQAGRGHVFALQGGAVTVDRIHKPVIAAGARAGEILPFSARMTWPHEARSAA